MTVSTPGDWADSRGGSNSESPNQLVVHDWDVDGWEPFTAQTITPDGVQNFSTAVTNSRGVVSGALAPGGMRVGYLHRDTRWRDAEVRSVIWGPTADWNGTNAQQGHLHRVRSIGGGVWEGVAIWTSVVFGGDYSFLHVAPVRFDGTGAVFEFGAEPEDAFGAADINYISRQARIIGHQRFQFIDWLNSYTLADASLIDHLAPGDVVSVTGLTDATFNETNQPISATSVNNSTVTVVEPTTTSAVPYTTDGGGDISPSGVDLQKRYCPQVLATRIIGGSATSATVEVKRWRAGEPEPDWGDGRVLRGPVEPNLDVPTVPTGPGLHGLWAAHFSNGSGGAWGRVQFTRQ